MRQPIPLLGLLTLAAFLVSGCHKTDPGTANTPSTEKAHDAEVLNLFWWSDFMAPDNEMHRLFVQTEDSPEQARTITRLWQKFKTGQ